MLASSLALGKAIEEKTIVELKVILKQKKLKISGNKADLIGRIKNDEIKEKQNPIQNRLEKYTVAELRGILRQHKISGVRGKKKYLIEKIMNTKIFKNQKLLTDFGFKHTEYKPKSVSNVRKMKQLKLKVK